MAGNKLSVSVAGVSIATAFKTIIQVTAPTNHGAIVELIEFAGLTSTATEKIEYELVAGESAGSGSSPITPVAKNADMGDESHGLTAANGHSTEPTGGRVIKRGIVNGLGGDRFGVGIRLNPGERMSLRCKATSSNTIASTFHLDV